MISRLIIAITGPLVRNSRGLRGLNGWAACQRPIRVIRAIRCSFCDFDLSLYNAQHNCSITDSYPPQEVSMVLRRVILVLSAGFVLGLLLHTTPILAHHSTAMYNMD